MFGARGCVKCHAVNGVGGMVGPDLGRIERPRSFFDLAAALWNHAPRMAERMRQQGIARPRLDAREMGDLVAFLFTLPVSGTRPAAVPADAVGDHRQVDELRPSRAVAKRPHDGAVLVVGDLVLADSVVDDREAEVA